MDSLFALLGFAGFAVGVIWSVIAKIKKQPIKTPLIVLCAGVVLFFIGAAMGTSNEPGEATNNTEITVDTVLTTTTTTTTAETTTVATTQKQLTGNYLIDECNIINRTVINGTGTTSIGTRWDIRADKDRVSQMTNKEFGEFLNQVIDDANTKKINWVTIVFADRTGIQFTGSDKSFPTYGTIDNEGMVIETKEMFSTSKSYDLSKILSK